MRKFTFIGICCMSELILTWRVHMSDMSVCKSWRLFRLKVQQETVSRHEGVATRAQECDTELRFQIGVMLLHVCLPHPASHTITKSSNDHCIKLHHWHGGRWWQIQCDRLGSSTYLTYLIWRLKSQCQELWLAIIMSHALSGLALFEKAASYLFGL